MVFLFLISLETTILLPPIIAPIYILKECKDSLFFMLFSTLVIDTVFKIVAVLRGVSFCYGLI